eukprot:CAMPEP_0168766972 /NCGR_PEP_ID=MMETSP0725-20121227/1114_1 /TAXON_ID=265536 /ORGANISM="Amphiprora sp., Strain CCMP467" /LENGTH=325 /DNA_ID=CAMNT_0008816271 /DNA_START=22 /DNA_END=999 /DNA_ORIENTATION=+
MTKHKIFAYSVAASFFVGLSSWQQVSLSVPFVRTDLPSKHLAADRCYHVFLDVGANLGVHGRFLMEPEMYPDVPVIHKIFDNFFGTRRNNSGICVFEVEANPLHHPKIEATAQAYAKIGWRYHLIKAGASDHNGSMQFWHNQNGNSRETGFSTHKHGAESGKVDIPVFRLSHFILSEIVPRKLPPYLSGITSARRPTIVMKMDIEGSEYLVFPDLLVTGALCHLDFVFGEDHGFMAPIRFPHVNPSHPKQLRNFDKSNSDWINSNPYLAELNVTKKEAKTIINYATKIVHFSRTCKTKYLHYDTEAYGDDGVPLPTKVRHPKSLG